jgi:DNA-binding response OmpR family regulator
MSIGLALLVSADPVTIQQFSHALQELSISPELCEEVPAAIGLLNRRKFEAVIVDLQLGEQCGRILDEVRVSLSNRTAVTMWKTQHRSVEEQVLSLSGPFLHSQFAAPSSLHME